MRRSASARETGDDLTPEQLAWFQAIVGRHLRFYGRVRTPQERRRFRGDEPLYLAVCGAFNAVHALNVKLHYLSFEPRTAGRVKLDLKTGRPSADSGEGADIRRTSRGRRMCLTTTFHAEGPMRF